MSKNERKCPNWDLMERKECGISDGGLYIPMPEHVTLFCLSPDYSNCRKYVKGCESVLAQSGSNDIKLSHIRDRRMFKRYPKVLFLDLMKCGMNLSPLEMSNYKAKTIDLSAGGLRFESSQQFEIDTVISFVMDPEHSVECMNGVGKVKWCIPMKDSGKFESGIAFSNYSTSEDVIGFLDL